MKPHSVLNYLHVQFKSPQTYGFKEGFKKETFKDTLKVENYFLPA